MKKFVYGSNLIAHRGASAYAPENTMSAFVKAKDLDAKWLEFDVMQTADGELVIFHDDTLERTTNGVGNLADFSYTELCKLDAGKWFSADFRDEKIATFLQVMEFARDNDLAVNIEIKPCDSRENIFIEKLLSDLNALQIQLSNKILFSSFSYTALIELRKHSTTANIAYLMHEWQENWRGIAKNLNCVAIHLNGEIITRERVNEITHEDYAIAVYTINLKSQAAQLFALGVDAIFTDKTDLLSN